MSPDTHDRIPGGPPLPVAFGGPDHGVVLAKARTHNSQALVVARKPSTGVSPQMRHGVWVLAFAEDDMRRWSVRTFAQIRLSSALQLGDVPRIRAQLAAFGSATADVGRGNRHIGLARQAKLFALAHHKAVEKFDLGAPAFLHVPRPIEGRCSEEVRAPSLKRCSSQAYLLSRRPRRSRDRLGRADAKSLPVVSPALGRRGSLRCRAGKENCGGLNLFCHLCSPVPVSPVQAGKPVAHDIGDQLRPALAPQIASVTLALSA